MSVLAGTGSESGHCCQFTAAMELLLPVTPMCSTAPALPQIQQDDVKCLSQHRRGRDPSGTAQLSTAALGTEEEEKPKFAGQVNGCFLLGITRNKPPPRTACWGRRP